MGGGQRQVRYESVLATLSGHVLAWTCTLGRSRLPGIRGLYHGRQSVALADDQLLRSLGPAVATVKATRTVLQTHIDMLRKRGISWNAIGSVLGMSRQAACERFS